MSLLLASYECSVLTFHILVNICLQLSLFFFYLCHVHTAFFCCIMTHQNEIWRVSIILYRYAFEPLRKPKEKFDLHRRHYTLRIQRPDARLHYVFTYFSYVTDHFSLLRVPEESGKSAKNRRYENVSWGCGRKAESLIKKSQIFIQNDENHCVVLLFILIFEVLMNRRITSLVVTGYCWFKFIFYRGRWICSVLRQQNNLVQDGKPTRD